MSKKNQVLDTNIAEMPKSHVSFSIVVPAPEPEVIKIPFSVWFSGKLKAGKVRIYQDYALFVFFAKQGLTDLEDADRYEEMFKKF